MKTLTSIATFFLQLLFPARCAGCGTSGSSLCVKCQSQLESARGISSSWYSAAFSYKNRIVKKVITDLKFRHKKEAAQILAMLAADSLIEFLYETMIADDATPIVLVPIPPHEKRKTERGFNQAAFIANTLAQVLPNTHVELILSRIRPTAPQSSIQQKAKRLANMQGAFAARPKNPQEELILIIDDIITTGATMEAARAALGTAGYKTVYGFAIAYTSLGK